MVLPPGIQFILVSLVAKTVKRLPAMRETLVRSLSQEDPLEKEMATHSSTLAWKIPWTEDPSSKPSILLCSAFFIVQLLHPYMTTGKTIVLTRWTFFVLRLI